MNDIPRTLLPLGVFGRGWPSSESERVRRELLPLVGKLSEDECPLIARYLRAGTVVFALMEWTTDVIGAFPEPKLEKFRPGFHILEAVGGRFDVAGGSGILTDGTYYWRTDTADYVEHYWTGLPDEFIRHGRSLGWMAPPQLSHEDFLVAYDYLRENMRALFPEADQP
jgi:hypothetical protein